MESRLMLSGNQLDDSIFNFDSPGDFAVISQVDIQPSSSPGTDGTIASAGSLTDAAPRSNESPSFPTNGAGYAMELGFGNDHVAKIGEFDSQLLAGLNTNSTGLAEYVGPQGRSIVIVPRLVLGHTEFGAVVGAIDSVAAYRPIDLPGSFFESGIQGKLGAVLDTDGKFDFIFDANPILSYGDVQEILVQRQQDSDGVAHGLEGTGVELVATGPNTDVGTLGVVDSDPAQFLGPQPFSHVVTAESNSASTVGPATSIDPTTITVRPGPSNIANSDAQEGGATSALSQQDEVHGDSVAANSDANLTQAAADLLAQDIIIADNSPANSETVGEDSKDAITSAAVEPTQSVADTNAGDANVVASTDVPTDGGMVSIEEIVAAVQGAPTDSGDTLYASAESETQIAGELTRVAVMELIEGEADPAATGAGNAYVGVVATNDATDGGRADVADSPQSMAERAINAVAQQAVAGISLVTPVNPGMLMTAIGSLRNAVQAASLTSLSDSSESPSEAAFSQWDDSAPGKSAVAGPREWSHWGLAAPILIALACDRVAAAQEKRQRRDSSRQPDKRPHDAR
jgi:hypothetical protein